MRNCALTALLLVAALGARAADKITLVLDWYINPDHAPIAVAEQIGAFKEAGLDVTLVPPSDPALPPRLVTAGQADLAITYQQQLYYFAQDKLPLVRVGTLVNTPLDTIITLDKRIKTPADLKGKRVGYSVGGTEGATLDTIARHVNIDPKSIKTVNVNFQLTSALLAGQVDAILGGYRNIEAVELALQGKEPVVMNVEDYGIPAYDELVIVANRAEARAPKIKKFLPARPPAGELAGFCEGPSGAEYRTQQAGLVQNRAALRGRSRRPGPRTLRRLRPLSAGQ